MALKLSLKPGEQIVINGAVLANGDRRATMVVRNKASILREKDIMKEEDVNSPARRIYFPIMLMYMDEQNYELYYREFLMRMNQFMGAITSPEAIQNCVEISKDVMEKKYYKALLTCRKLIAFEEERLNYDQKE